MEGRPLDGLGDSLPPDTRFFVMIAPSALVMAGSLVAWVPCRDFERAGLYLLGFGDTLRVHQCGASENDRLIIIDPQEPATVTREHFRTIVEGRVIGVMAPSGSDSLSRK
jgi:hypothetical protein